MTIQGGVEANQGMPVEETDKRPIIHFAGDILREVPPGYILMPREDGTFGLIPMPGPYTGYFDER